MQTPLMVVALVVQAVAIWIALRHFRARTAAAYMDRFSRPDMRDIRQRVDSWLACASSDEERLRVLKGEDPPVSVDEIRVFANFFQELGLLCEERLMHPRTTRLLFDYLAPHYWGQLSFWVCWYRQDRNDQTLYKRFESFASAMGYKSTGVS